MKPAQAHNKKRALSAVLAPHMDEGQGSAGDRPTAVLPQSEIKLISSCSAAVRDYCRGHRCGRAEIGCHLEGLPREGLWVIHNMWAGGWPLACAALLFGGVHRWFTIVMICLFA